MVAALEREVRPLVKRWRVSEREHAGRRCRFFTEGEKADEAVLVCGGIGAGSARRAAEAAIAIYTPTVIYSIGFAGGLVSELKVGDVVQPARVIDAGDGSRVDLAGGEGVLVSFGAVASPAQKAKLKESFGAQLVDMEAAAVARAAQARGVEFKAVKAISDEFDFALPALEQFIDAEGQLQQGRLAAYAALRPWLWPKLRRLAINSNRASRALSDWLATSLKRMIECAPEPKAEGTHHP